MVETVFQNVLKKKKKKKKAIWLTMGKGEPAWPSGKAFVWEQKDLGSNPLRLSFLFKSCWSVDTDL